MFLDLKYAFVRFVFRILAQYISETRCNWLHVIYDHPDLKGLEIMSEVDRFVVLSAGCEGSLMLHLTGVDVSIQFSHVLATFQTSFKVFSATARKVFAMRLSRFSVSKGNDLHNRQAHLFAFETIFYIIFKIAVKNIRAGFQVKTKD